jgi:hypothetical protein
MWNGASYPPQLVTPLEEIRESRKRMSEKCQHDPAKLVALKAASEKYSSQVEAYRRTHAFPSETLPER